HRGVRQREPELGGELAGRAHVTDRAARPLTVERHETQAGNGDQGLGLEEGLDPDTGAAPPAEVIQIRRVGGNPGPASPEQITYPHNRTPPPQLPLPGAEPSIS